MQYIQMTTYATWYKDITQDNILEHSCHLVTPHKKQHNYKVGRSIQTNRCSQKYLDHSRFRYNLKNYSRDYSLLRVEAHQIRVQEGLDSQKPRELLALLSECLMR